MTASLDESMIDAFTIAIEQEVTDEDRVPSDITADNILANLEDMTTEERQAEIIRIVGDLAFAFNGVVTQGKEEVAAKKAERERLEREEQERAIREVAERSARRREEIARVREQEAAEVRERFGGREPSCGMPNCRHQECYDGTFRRLRAQAQATTATFGVWSSGNYISAPAIDPEQWERALLSPVPVATVGDDDNW